MKSLLSKRGQVVQGNWTAKSVGSRNSWPEGLRSNGGDFFDRGLPIGKSAIQQVGKPALRGNGEAGISLIECLVYIAVVLVVLGTATVGFNRCWDDSKQLRRNADDIVRSLHAGEQWRADVRAATGEIRVIDQPGKQQLIIPVRAGQVIYEFSGGAVQRRAGATARPVVLLDRVKSSQMQLESCAHVTAWRWELELAPARKNARVRPLFTFETVAGHTMTR